MSLPATASQTAAPTQKGPGMFLEYRPVPLNMTFLPGGFGHAQSQHAHGQSHLSTCAQLHDVFMPVGLLTPL